MAVGIRGDTSVFLRSCVDRLTMINAGDLRRMFDLFRDQGVKKVIMAGQVNPNNLFDEQLRFDEEFRGLFLAMKDRKADTIFAAIAQKLQEHGLELIESTFLLDKYLAPKGTLTRRGPTVEELQDIGFGREIAKAMGGLDVGQTVVVKEKAIVAIEAMEGTDRTIRRGGKIAQRGAVVVKMSKPDQDARFDIPVIGPRTMTAMRRAQAGCIAVEAGKTIIIDREKTVRLADRFGICLVCV